MSLRRATVTHEAALCCATQALSTERQEVMGLLLGSWRRDPATGEAIEAEVRHVVALARTDRRKDRVEVGYEQLAAATERASALTAATGVETRIIGWVHSHPHITVLPSHVDLRTQATYQQMDPGFLGLIVAVFQDDAKNQLGRMELTAFQSVPPGSGGGGGGGGFIETIDADSGVEEELDDFCMAHDHPPPLPIASTRRGLRSGGGGTGQSQDPAGAVLVPDEDVLFALDAAGPDGDDAVPMAVACESSAAAAGGGAGGYVRKGVPIRLVAAAALESGGKVEQQQPQQGAGAGVGESVVASPTATATATADAARCVVSLQEVLLAEDRFFYESAARANARNNAGGGDVHALYNAAVYAKALAALMEESGLPLLNALEAVLLNLRRDRARWAAANAKLRARLLERGGEDEAAAAAAAAEAAPMDTNGEGAGGHTSRAAGLRDAKRGVLMQVVEGAGADAPEGLVRVSMDRVYGPTADEARCCLGTWRLRLGPGDEGDEGEAAAAAAAAAEGSAGAGGGLLLKGQLVSIQPAARTHGPGAVCFTLAAPTRQVVCVGVEGTKASALWIDNVAPIVCPDLL